MDWKSGWSFVVFELGCFALPFVAAIFMIGLMVGAFVGGCAK